MLETFRNSRNNCQVGPKTVVSSMNRGVKRGLRRKEVFDP